MQFHVLQIRQHIHMAKNPSPAAYFAGDVYAHNILLDKTTGHATLCDFGASFVYPPSHWFWERMEVKMMAVFGSLSRSCRSKNVRTCL